MTFSINVYLLGNGFYFFLRGFFSRLHVDVDFLFWVSVCCVGSAPELMELQLFILDQHTSAPMLMDAGCCTKVQRLCGERRAGVVFGADTFFTQDVFVRYFYMDYQYW